MNGEHVRADAAVVEQVEDDPRRPWKAIAAGLAPAVITLLWALTPGSDAGSSLSQPEIGAVVTAALGAFGITFAVPNAKRVKTAKRGNDWE